MDDKTRKLINRIKELRDRLADAETSLRERSDKAESGSYYGAYYDGKADGIAEASEGLRKTVSDWAEEILGELEG